MRPAVDLAGKIDKNDWRHGVVDQLRGGPSGYGGDDGDNRAEPGLAWRTAPARVFGRYDYAGPFFISCDHGCFHREQSHGVGAGTGSSVCGSDDFDVGETRRAVARACVEAIGRADVFFAWLDDPTAHGTLVEIGDALALKERTGKPSRVIVGRLVPCAISFEDWVDKDRLAAAMAADRAAPEGYTAAEWSHGAVVGVADLEFDFEQWSVRDAMWFPSALPGVEHAEGPDPASVLRAVLEPRPSFESPAEQAFWTAWRTVGGPELAVQHEVFGGAYRLDFAHVATQTAIEVDGLAYHGDQEAFRRDRERDRRLTGAGWRVVRFTAKEVFADARRCAREAAALCGDGARAQVAASATARRRVRITVASSRWNQAGEAIRAVLDAAEPGVHSIEVANEDGRTMWLRGGVRYGAILRTELRRLGLEESTEVTL